MKKSTVLFTVLAIVICTFLCGCSDTYKNEAELLEKARKELQTANADTIELRQAGECRREDSVLMWYVSGNEYQAHTYLALEFREENSDRYKYVHTYRPIKRGTDIFALLWHDDYVFLVNNPDCTTIRITDKSGVNDISITEGDYPYLYHYENAVVSGYGFEYVFLDQDGNELG